MEFRHLRYFQAVAETLSFSRAAERLRVAQPAISRQIHALEQEIGLKLFIRSTTRVRLTDAGRYFYGETDRLLAQLAGSVAAAQEIARGCRGELNLGSDWRILIPQISEAVVRYRAEFPQVTVNLVELPIHIQIDALKDGRIHLGFVHQAFVDTRSDLASQPLFSADMKVVVAASHPLARRTSIPLHELRNEAWIKLDEKNHPGFRSLMVGLCKPALFTPKFGRVAHSIEGMLGLIAIGDGLGLVPSSLISRPNPALRYLDTDCPPFEFHALWSKDSPPEPRTQFIRILRELIGAAKPPRKTK